MSQGSGSKNSMVVQIVEEEKAATDWDIAPELVLQEKIEQADALDLWNLGCIFSELAFLTAPNLSKGKVVFRKSERLPQIEVEKCYT
jgi:hypothetical protein